MRKAIIIGEEPTKESKGIEFTHYLVSKGVLTSDFDNKPKDMQKITAFTDIMGLTVFCCIDCDDDNLIYFGFLNDGTY